MIRYALKCENDHSFESWFQSASSFDGLKATGMVTCPSCGSSKVTKAIMTPQVRSARKAAAGTARLSKPENETERALAALKARIEAESEYVGPSFAGEARAMHVGDAPERAIYGEAKLDEAKALIEDGIPVAPLPFTPSRKSN